MRSQVVIIATLLLNGSLFAFNLLVAISSGSRAVLAQAIYAITDLVGSALLLWGLYASHLPADYRHPFGRGKERFYWALVSIVITFTIAGILALTTGVSQVSSPNPVSHIGDALLVVGATLGVSAVSIAVTLREVRRSQQTLQSLLESRHIGLKSVFYQDSRFDYRLPGGLLLTDRRLSDPELRRGRCRGDHRGGFAGHHGDRLDARKSRAPDRSGPRPRGGPHHPRRRGARRSCLQGAGPPINGPRAGTTRFSRCGSTSTTD